MKIRNLIPWAYAMAVAVLVLAVFSMAQSEIAIELFIGAMLVQIVFAVMAIYELRGSEHFTRGEKGDWTILILCAPLIFGIFYLLKLRKRILYI